MWLYLEPCDVTLFRDGRPFDAGEHSRARGHRLPPPSVIQGALRAAAMARLGGGERSFDELAKDESVTKALGDADSVGRFRMMGPFPARRAGENGAISLLLTQPLDHVSVGEQPSVLCMKPFNEGEMCDLGAGGLSLHFAPTPGQISQKVGWLSVEGFRNYLLKGSAAAVLEGFDHVQETRFHNERDRKKGAAAEGRLFMVQYGRLGPGMGFACRVDEGTATTLSDDGSLRLGGEGRGATYRKCSDDPTGSLSCGETVKALAESIVSNKAFKVVLMQPGIFPEGWCPPFIDPETLEGTVAGCRLKLTAAIVGKPVPVMRMKAAAVPRPSRLAVPPGSTFTFQLLDSVDSDAAMPLMECLHGVPVPGSEEGEIGMGLAYVGVAHVPE